MESLDNQDMQESIQDATPLEKAKKTPKPRSEKQMENFKKLQEKRKEAIEKKKLEKRIEASKLLLEQEITPPTPAKQKKVKNPSPPPSEDEEESDSSVEKIIVNVKNKKKTKKKAKEIIIYKDDDSDSGESEEERPSGTSRYSDVQQEYKQPKRVLKTQQNKKSKTKIYQQEQPQMFKSQPMNYFVDWLYEERIIIDFKRIDKIRSYQFEKEKKKK